jgi:hypothetical protein
VYEVRLQTMLELDRHALVFFNKKWKFSVDTAKLNFVPVQLSIMPLDIFHRGSSQARQSHAS